MENLKSRVMGNEAITNLLISENCDETLVVLSLELIPESTTRYAYCFSLGKAIQQTVDSHSRPDFRLIATGIPKIGRAHV